MQLAITKMSSKGQVVIPREMREDIEEGEKIIVIKNSRQLILEKASDIDKNLREELEFAKKTERAWKEYKKGRFTSSNAEDFLTELKKW